MVSTERSVQAIQCYDGPPLTFMEVCGTHTHNIFRYGIRDLLPPSIRLISGPGCPVCVTPASYIDSACALSLREHTVVCTFGDMVRVPGRHTSLAEAKAAGGRVRILYAPMDMLAWAEREPDTTFCMAAVGFETTLPVYALMLRESARRGLHNVHFLLAARALLPALTWICENETGIDGFIGPGHVSAVIGAGAYAPLCEKFRVPVAVAGFGYEHIIAAIHDLILQCREGTHKVRNLYPNAVAERGNPAALQLISEIFVKKPSVWRGLGRIESSGYFLAPGFEDFGLSGGAEDAEEDEPAGCLCGNIIAGRAEPKDCALFGRDCTPLHPVGPCMVSNEGACGIWYRGGAKGEKRA